MGEIFVGYTQPFLRMLGWWLEVGGVIYFSLGPFLGSGLSRELFLATVLLHINCLLFGVVGFFLKHFVTSAEVRRAL
jgi:hypothetical protein